MWSLRASPGRTEPIGWVAVEKALESWTWEGERSARAAPSRYETLAANAPTRGQRQRRAAPASREESEKMLAVPLIRSANRPQSWRCDIGGQANLRGDAAATTQALMRRRISTHAPCIPRVIRRSDSSPFEARSDCHVLADLLIALMRSACLPLTAPSRRARTAILRRSTLVTDNAHVRVEMFSRPWTDKSHCGRL